MRPRYLVGFIVLLLFDTLSQVSFKMAGLHAPFVAAPSWVLHAITEPWMYGAIAGYVGAFVTWMSLLRHAPIGPAFAASHLDIIGVMAVSVPLFGEALTLREIVGAGVIMVGIICLAFSEGRSMR